MRRSHLLLLCVAAATLAGCGLKGPLVPAPAPAPASTSAAPVHVAVPASTPP